MPNISMIRYSKDTDMTKNSIPILKSLADKIIIFLFLFNLISNIPNIKNCFGFFHYGNLALKYIMPIIIIIHKLIHKSKQIFD